MRTCIAPSLPGKLEEELGLMTDSMLGVFGSDSDRETSPRLTEYVHLKHPPSTLSGFDPETHRSNPVMGFIPQYVSGVPCRDEVSSRPTHTHTHRQLPRHAYKCKLGAEDLAKLQRAVHLGMRAKTANGNFRA